MVPLAGVGLPGHFVVAHFGVSQPLLLDPFAG
jgi:Transglutaminase-like superfamily